MCIVLLLYLVSQIDQPDDTGIQVFARTRVYTIYSSCFLSSILHRSGEMLVIQCVVGEGKGKICLHRKEIGPRLGGKKTLFCCALILRRLRKTVKAVKEKCRDIV